MIYFQKVNHFERFKISKHKLFKYNAGENMIRYHYYHQTQSPSSACGLMTHRICLTHMNSFTIAKWTFAWNNKSIHEPRIFIFVLHLSAVEVIVKIITCSSSKCTSIPAHGASNKLNLQKQTTLSPWNEKEIIIIFQSLLSISRSKFLSHTHKLGGKNS